MKKTIIILIAITIGCGVNCFAQGRVTRPKKETTSTRPKPTNAKPTNAKPTTASPTNQRQNNKQLTGAINGHDWVDLDLPSGLKWATCNVGAANPEDYGDYFAWGETEPKSEYSEDTSLTNGKSVSKLKSKGIINSSGIFNRNFDAASTNWGATWRMPTEEEYDELIKNCTWTRGSQSGTNGYKVTGSNGKSIFLPNAGSYFSTSLIGGGNHGNYWCSSVYDDKNQAYDLCFFDDLLNTLWGRRYYGYSIRPVSE